MEIITGKNKVEVDNSVLFDRYGFTGEFSPMRDLRVNQPYRLAGTSFGSTIDTNFWTASNSGTGSASGIASSIATMTSGTANNGYGHLTTVRTGRFIFAHPLLFRAAIRLTALSKSGTTRRWGAFSVSGITPQNGVYFSVDQNNTLSVNYASGGSVTSISSGSFNGDVTSYTMDTNVHAYEIIYFTMGIWFYVDNVLIHHVTPTTSILYTTLNVPISITSLNSASGTISASVECWNATILRLGREITKPIYRYQSGTTTGLVLKLSAGILHNIIISGVSNNSVVTLYDNTAASGTVVFSTGAMSANTTPFSLPFYSLAFFTGLTLAITGASSTVTVMYE